MSKLNPKIKKNQISKLNPKMKKSIKAIQIINTKSTYLLVMVLPKYNSRLIYALTNLRL